MSPTSDALAAPLNRYFELRYRVCMAACYLASQTLAALNCETWVSTQQMGTFSNSAGLFFRWRCYQVVVKIKGATEKTARRSVLPARCPLPWIPCLSVGSSYRDFGPTCGLGLDEPVRTGILSAGALVCGVSELLVPYNSGGSWSPSKWENRPTKIASLPQSPPKDKPGDWTGTSLT
jgi:hypothetical protein